MNTSSRSPSAGYTLLEIMVVVMLIGLVATVSLPSVHRLTTSGLRSRTVALVGFLRDVQRLAVTQPHYTVRVRFDTDDQLLYAEQRAKVLDAEWEEAGSGWDDPRRYRFAVDGGRADGMRISELSLDGKKQQKDKWEVYFYADGSRDAAAMTVELPGSKNAYKVVIPPLIEPIEVVSTNTSRRSHKTNQRR